MKLMKVILENENMILGSKKNKNVTLEKNELDIRKIKLNIFRWKNIIFNIIN